MTEKIESAAPTEDPRPRLARGGVVHPDNIGGLRGRDEPMLRWFDYEHLRSSAMRSMSSQFKNLAIDVCDRVPASEERTVALRKLLEAKDAAVRCALDAAPKVQINVVSSPDPVQTAADITRRIQEHRA